MAIANMIHLCDEDPTSSANNHDVVDSRVGVRQEPLTVQVDTLIQSDPPHLHYSARLREANSTEPNIQCGQGLAIGSTTSSWWSRTEQGERMAGSWS